MTTELQGRYLTHSPGHIVTLNLTTDKLRSFSVSVREPSVLKPCSTKSMAGISGSYKGLHTTTLVPTGLPMAKAVIRRFVTVGGHSVRDVRWTLWHRNWFSAEYFRFSLSVSFHQFSILILYYQRYVTLAINRVVKQHN